ncbi:hypothetical protein RRV45_13725 [Bacillus sp. DTU_2020_1000418_1_SI_GHA_SEK_038]|uniref:hypothetical protein n=1 Tax=Bacillus sp. DTU_2020_1000418_1_SI_GHA_SEK_038 TaxID=3077585 RepID=UPI0028E9E868|nr:hypothetical protein [Bacillus sp. DTU_2020_1000418_1_SI_GHA_SEK_038]WNS73976.1 hypothetical protein RRV45_13725 [Bacillus sp. DTU_2020_1000418_1_SI_GHA_SEK_038]
MNSSSGNETNIKLPFSFILVSIIAIIGSQILLLFHGDYMISGQFRVPGIWSAAHLFLLGWALMIAMGAMYQLVPVAFLTPIWSEKFGFIQFGVYVIGVFSFAHFLFYEPQKALVPGIITLIGILMFLFQMFMTLRKQAKPNILTLYVGTALICLLITIILGITMLFSMKTGFAGHYYQAIFKSHLLLGMTGWFTLLIFGFSYKMVPMFSLSHGFTMKLANYVYPVYTIGLAAAAISFFIESKALLTAALFFLFAGFIIFMYHISNILKKRVKKKLDYSFIFALIAIISGGIIHLAAFITGLLGVFHKAAGPLLFLYMFLWIAFSIIGYLYKIVPFLWWTAKYSKEIGKKDVPALKDMINDRAATPVFTCLMIGAIGVAVSLSIGGKALFYPSQIIFTFACLMFSIAIAKVVKK